MERGAATKIFLAGGAAVANRPAPSRGRQRSVGMVVGWRIGPAQRLHKSGGSPYLTTCIKSALRLIGAPPTVPSGTVAANLGDAALRGKGGRYARYPF
jgi:hypothetical protein